MVRTTDELNYASIIIVGEEEWTSFAYFNPNAYPKFLKKIVNSCGERLALTLYYAKLIESQMSRDIDDFLIRLNQQTQIANLPDTPRFVAYYRGMTYLASLHGVLYSLKSFLDVMSTLWASLILGRKQTLLFNKGKVNGEVIAGGRVINWLQQSVPSNFHNAEQLASIIESNSRRWITQAVEYRNTLVHYGEINGLKHLRVILQKGRREYSHEDILMPEMPDGTLVKDYCKMLIKNVCSFISDGLTLHIRLLTVMLTKG